MCDAVLEAFGGRFQFQAHGVPHAAFTHVCSHTCLLSIFHTCLLAHRARSFALTQVAAQVHADAAAGGLEGWLAQPGLSVSRGFHKEFKHSPEVGRFFGNLAGLPPLQVPRHLPQLFPARILPWKG